MQDKTVFVTPAERIVEPVQREESAGNGVCGQEKLQLQHSPFALGGKRSKRPKINDSGEKSTRNGVCG